jgi:hypothetical protein
VPKFHWLGRGDEVRTFDEPTESDDETKNNIQQIRQLLDEDEGSQDEEGPTC